ncbi:MAG: outer membrane protein OmpA family [Myxococcales bacterium]|nr:outer membrane protein OmpA family [Myxococcales bacterium]
MRLAICLVCAGCGRVGFDTSDAPAAPDAHCTWSAFSTPAALPGPVQSGADDWSPSPTAGGTQIYFYTYRTTAFGKIYRAVRASVADPFGVATPVTELDNPTSDQFSPTATSDNLLLIYADAATGAFKLMSATRSSVGLPFDPPSQLANVNASNAVDDLYPSISADGLRLVFGSTRVNGAQAHLFETTRSDRAAAFATPRELAEVAKPGSDDWSPTLSADALDIFFSSNRGGPGGFDVYTSHRAAVDQPFAPPLLVPELSSPRDDVGLHLDPTGATMYLSYDAVVGGGNAELDVATRSCN